MRHFKSCLLPLAGILVLGATGAALAPLVQSRFAVAAILPQDPDTGQPFNMLAGVHFSAGETQKSESFTIPATKRAVIETVSVLGQTPRGEMLATLKTTAPGLRVPAQSMDHILALTFQGVIFSNRRAFAATQNVRLYANANTAVIAAGFRSSGDGIGFMAFRISGYLLSP
ncbi:MAG TPA: hypothetical protein VGW35_25135 [Methylomirabilota bacterium]|jgi:hypothetical protein|nr:hypothetical protein [Methylomirabilota bacterium]